MSFLSVNSHRVLRSSLALALVFFLLPESVLSQQPALPEDYDSLVRKLGDEDFSVRDRADRALSQAGLRAVRTLAKAAEHPDAEVRARVKRLLDVHNQTFLCIKECKPECLQALEYLNQVRGLGLQNPSGDDNLIYVGKCRGLTGLSLYGGESLTLDSLISAHSVTCRSFPFTRKISKAPDSATWRSSSIWKPFTSKDRLRTKG